MDTFGPSGPRRRQAFRATPDVPAQQLTAVGGNAARLGGSDPTSQVTLEGSAAIPMGCTRDQQLPSLRRRFVRARTSTRLGLNGGLCSALLSGCCRSEGMRPIQTPRPPSEPFRDAKPTIPQRGLIFHLGVPGPHLTLNWCGGRRRLVQRRRRVRIDTDPAKPSQ
jgi:hypothetical protein